MARVTNNAGEEFTDSFLVNEFDRTDVLAEAEFSMPLPEFYSADITVQAIRTFNGFPATGAFNGFDVFSTGIAEVSYNIEGVDFVNGGTAEILGFATIDFTLDSPSSFIFYDGLTDFSLEANSDGSLIQLDDGRQIDLFSMETLLPGSYRFSTMVDLLVAPGPEALGSMAFADRTDSFLGSSGLIFNTVPEPSTSVLLGLVIGCGALFRRREARPDAFNC